MAPEWSLLGLLYGVAGPVVNLCSNMGRHLPLLRQRLHQFRHCWLKQGLSPAVVTLTPASV